MKSWRVAVVVPARDEAAVLPDSLPGLLAQKYPGAARVILGEWFGRLLGRTDLDAEQAFLLGRAAFVALDGGSRYPGALMTEDAPAEFTAELHRSVPQPSPAAAPAAMLVQSLDPPALLAPVAALLRGAGPKGANAA